MVSVETEIPGTVESWEAWMKQKRLAMETQRAYSREVRELAAEFGDPVGLQEHEVRSHLRRRGGSPATQQRRLAALRSFYRFAILHDYRKDDPSFRIESAPVPVREAPRLSDDEVLESLGRLRPLYQSIALLILETGFKISEVLSIRASVPVPEEVEIFSRGKQSTRPISPLARKILEALGGRIPVGARAIQKHFHPHQLTASRLPRSCL